MKPIYKPKGRTIDRIYQAFGTSACAGMLESPERIESIRQADELLTKIEIVSGYTGEQILEMLMAGFELQKPEKLRVSLQDIVIEHGNERDIKSRRTSDEGS